VTITEETDYPFDARSSSPLKTASGEFPLHLRNRRADGSAEAEPVGDENIAARPASSPL